MPVRANKLLKFMATPAKVASTLDWRRMGGSILTMDIGQKRIGLAVASHPSLGGESEKLEALEMTLENRGHAERALSGSVVNKLSEIVEKYGICGFVVLWPLQKEGRAGAPCGKVLHTLDSLVQESNILTPTRPFCLYHRESMQDEDAFGRCKIYGKKCEKTMHKASEEQYVHECSSSVAADVWNDFCRKQWPELYESPREELPMLDFQWLSDYEDTQHYGKVAAL